MQALSYVSPNCIIPLLPDMICTNEFPSPGMSCVHKPDTPNETCHRLEFILPVLAAICSHHRGTSPPVLRRGGHTVNGFRLASKARTSHRDALPMIVGGHQSVTVSTGDASPCRESAVLGHHCVSREGKKKQSGKRGKGAKKIPRLAGLC